MSQANAELGAYKRCGNGRIHVAINQHDVRLARQHNRLEPAHDRGRLLRMRPRTDVQAFVWIRNLQCFEEHIRHECVIVLARMHQCLLVPSAPQRTVYGSRLHEVWPRANYVQNFH